MRKRLYEIIEAGKPGDSLSKAYDLFMIVCIVLSIVPLAFKSEPEGFILIDKITVVIFIIDYILRLLTADYKIQKGASSFIRYPFKPMAIIDLVSILPSLFAFNSGLKLLKVFRLARSLKVVKALKVFKTFRYSKNIEMILAVFKRQKKSLAVVCFLAFGYILLSALVIFNAEPDTFETFFDAVYWATISLTTVGYGDVYAISTLGKLITMVSAIFGIAIVALPAGIITAGYMDELKASERKRREQQKPSDAEV